VAYREVAQLEKGSRGELLGAELNEAGAAVEERLQQTGWRVPTCGGDVDVENRAEAWNGQDASASEPAPPFGFGA